MSLRAVALAATIALLAAASPWPAIDGLAPVLPATDVATAAEDPAGDAACVDGWRRLPLPDGGSGLVPYEVIVEAGRPSWILGGAVDGPLALRWRDDRWVRVDAGKGDVAAFIGGAARAGESTWAVGSVRPSRGRIAPIAGELRPRRWRRRPVRPLPSDRTALTDVAPKGDERAWAVGTKLVGGHTRAYALRWDGSRWQERSPRAGKAESGLVAVDSTERGDVWAVGWSQASSGWLRPLIVRAGGDGWRSDAGADVGPGIAALIDIVLPGPGDGWAVGYRVPAGESRHEVILEHWDGSAWASEPLPWAAAVSAIPNAVAADAAGNVWIAGSLLRDDGAGPRGFVATRTGETWQLTDSLLPPEGPSELLAVAVTESGAILAGSVDSAGVLFEACVDGEASVSSTVAGVPLADAAVASGRGAPAPTGADPAWAPVAGRLALGRPRKPAGFRIRDVASSTGLAAVVDTTRGLAHDLDGDGWTDVLYWNHGSAPQYHLGGPEGFSPGPASAFGQLDRHWCSVGDADGDGTPDIFCSGGRQRGRGIGDHELSSSPGLPTGGPTSDVRGARDPFGRGRAATFIELDGDGLPELFIATSADRGDGMPGMNRFFRNVDGHFFAAPDVGLDDSSGGWCAVAADIDDDGDDDLLHCVDRPTDGRPAGLRLHRNVNGTLRERSRTLGIEPFGDIDVIAADFTGDGRTDIVQLNRNRVRLLRRAGKRFKTAYEAAVPFATGVASGDVDGDGRLDLYVVTGNERGNPRDVLLVNDGNGRSFTSVRIPQATEGSGSGVIALDHDHNGLTDFVVLNGQGGFQGPTQLLASYPNP